MGRRAKPTAIKILEGNPGKRPLGKGEIKPDSGLPDMPNNLSKVARQEWKRLAPELDKLGLITRIDMTAFVCYCESYSTFVAARNAIKIDGMTVKVNGLLKKNPAVSIMNDASRLMRQYLTEFGLTPASRPRVSAQMKDPAQATLPGMNVHSENPNKPKLPSTPLTDDDFFEARHSVRH